MREVCCYIQPVSYTHLLNEIPDNNEFLYKICTENLEVRLDAVGGGISFIDKEKEDLPADLRSAVRWHDCDRGAGGAVAL